MGEAVMATEKIDPHIAAMQARERMARRWAWVCLIAAGLAFAVWQGTVAAGAFIVLAPLAIVYWMKS